MNKRSIFNYYTIDKPLVILIGTNMQRYYNDM